MGLPISCHFRIVITLPGSVCFAPSTASAAV
jgi:hypothetical protein